MKVALEIIPEEIVQQYNLHDVASNGWVYMDIRKGMLGLKQAGFIKNDRLYLHSQSLGMPPSPEPPPFGSTRRRTSLFPSQF